MKTITTIAFLLFAATSLFAAPARNVNASKADCPNVDAVNASPSSGNASTATRSTETPAPAKQHSPKMSTEGCLDCYLDYYVFGPPPALLTYGDFKFQMCKVKYCAD